MSIYYNQNLELTLFKCFFLLNLEIVFVRLAFDLFIYKIRNEHLLAYLRILVIFH